MSNHPEALDFLGVKPDLLQSHNGKTALISCVFFLLRSVLPVVGLAKLPTQTQRCPILDWSTTQSSQIIVTDATGGATPVLHPSHSDQYYPATSYRAKNGDVVSLKTFIIYVSSRGTTETERRIGRVEEILVPADQHTKIAMHVAITDFHLLPNRHPNLDLPCVDKTAHRTVIAPIVSKCHSHLNCASCD